MTKVKVLFDASAREFEFGVVNGAEKTVIMFRLSCDETIELIRGLKQEVKAKVSLQMPSMRPLLRVVSGGDA